MQQLPLLALSLHRPAPTDSIEVPDAIDNSPEYELARWVALVDAEARQAYVSGDEEQRQKAKYVHDFMAGAEPAGLGLALADLTPGVGPQNPTEWEDGQLSRVADSLEALELAGAALFGDVGKVVTGTDSNPRYASQIVFKTKAEQASDAGQAVTDAMKLDGTALEVLFLALKDREAQLYSFEERNDQTGRYPRLHRPPVMDPAEAGRTWWKVITLDMYNEVAQLQFGEGFQKRTELKRFKYPFTLRRRDQRIFSDLRGDPQDWYGHGAGPMILDGGVLNFDRSRVMAPINTASRWPRGREGTLKALPPDAGGQPQPFKLPHFMTTELEHYHGLRAPLGAMLFHGTLKRYSRTIDQTINFELGGGAMGPGFYLTSNPNEAKAYAIERLKQARDPASDRFIDDWDKDTREDEFITVVAVYVDRPYELEQRPLGPPTANGRNWTHNVLLNAEGNADKTFYHNPGDQRFNQFVLHRSCKPNLIIVGVHDIHLTGDFQHTGINDARHPGEFYTGFQV